MDPSKLFENGKINWKIKLMSAPEKVYQLLTTDKGREKFWVESSVRLEDNSYEFTFPSGFKTNIKVIKLVENELFRITYIDNSLVTFTLSPEGSGTILQVTDEGTDPEWLPVVYAGWVSVLMSLKAAVDFNVDLRNHDSKFSWDKGFCDN